ncbi:MAG: hypothetical protein MZV63_33170 [Marinilabiliales bacterium]|nr:hypothetical protein [Marinilabiliales bacterium]
MAAVFGYFILGESLNLLQIAGMAIVILGIALAIFNRPVKGERLSIKLSPAGLLYAFLGAIGQGLGIVLSKYGMEGYDAFASTQIRIIAGFAGFAFIISMLRRWGNVWSAMQNPSCNESVAAGRLLRSVPWHILLPAFSKTYPGWHCIDNHGHSSCADSWLRQHGYTRRKSPPWRSQVRS